MRRAYTSSFRNCPGGRDGCLKKQKMVWGKCFKVICICGGLGVWMTVLCEAEAILNSVETFLIQILHMEGGIKNFPHRSD